jgi:predicted MFS family arabinose efflux permease
VEAPDQPADDPAALAGAVLDEEAKRQTEQAARSAVTVLPDDLLPGVGADSMPLRETLRTGGVAMVTVLALLAMAEQFERVALGVLAPDIQDTLNVSDTTLIGISAFGGISLVLGAIPLAWLADRMSRVRIVWVASLGWAAASVLNGLVVNPFQMFCSRVLVGFGQSYSLPVFACSPTRTRSRAGPGSSAPTSWPSPWAR